MKFSTFAWRPLLVLHGFALSMKPNGLCYSVAKSYNTCQMWILTSFRSFNWVVNILNGIGENILRGVDLF